MIRFGLALGLVGAPGPQIKAQAPEPLKESAIAEASLGTDGFAQSGDVKIHFVTSGKGPLVVMIHGFPDYWFTWRKQMPALAESFQVVAIDQRGYNKSDQPVGVENYTIDKLVGDVRSVIRHFEREKAIIVGHDWGGMVAWSFAMAHPDLTLVTIPDADHFVQQDAPELVTRTMVDWLKRSER